MSVDDIWKRMHGFVYALLICTREALDDIKKKSSNWDESKNATIDGVIQRQAKLASTFRESMTKGQSFQGPNIYRKDFYKKVTGMADDVSFFESFLSLASMTVFQSS